MRQLRRLSPLALLALLGTWDYWHPRHNLLRNYPLTAHFRWLFEALRPMIRQYLFESEEDGTGFSARNGRWFIAAPGAFDSARFRDLAQDPQIKMIELKLSQGAKPGGGGLLLVILRTSQCPAAHRR